MTRYINMKSKDGIETIDQFTMGEAAPSNPKEFHKYVRDMLNETRMAYQGSGCYIYISQRSTKEWREESC